MTTVALRYERRQVAMADLLPERDPNHLELCAVHADRLVPPIGWVVRDERHGAERPVSPLGLDHEHESVGS